MGLPGGQQGTEDGVKGRFLTFYRREWPRVAVVQAMVLGGASLLAGRKRQTNLRALAVMNAMTMCAHQYEEYVDPGYFPGVVNVGLFKSDQPLNYPFNANSAMCANVFFRALYVPAMIFPRVKWLGLPPVLLGIGQAFAHGIVAPRMTGTRYSPGALTAGCSPMDRAPIPSHKRGKPADKGEQMTPLKFFSRHWHDVGLVSAVIAGVYLAVAWKDLDVIQRILIINFIIVLLHQFEEYSWPGGFPYVANKIFIPLVGGRFFKPLNQLASAAANCTFAYVFYLLPVVFPQEVWLALGTFIFGSILQVIGHGIVVNYQIRSLISPGTVTAVFGWLPLGVIYVEYIYDHGLVSGWDWPLAVAYTIAGAIGCFYLVEQVWLGSEDPNYHPFDEDELARFRIPEKFEAAQRLRAEKKSA